MKQKVLYQGAEAVIVKEKDFIIKDRIKKSYRLPEIDEKIRKQRTKSETKLLEKASKIINVPLPLSINEKRGDKNKTSEDHHYNLLIFGDRNVAGYHR